MGILTALQKIAKLGVDGAATPLRMYVTQAVLT